MAEIQKDALYAGKWVLPNGEIFQCKPEEIAHYQKRINEMIQKGNHIPVTWEHQPKSENPMSKEEFHQALAEKTRNTIGHIKTAQTSENKLDVSLDVPNEEDFKKLPSIKFVSPTIKYDVTDPLGNKWPGPSITALAVTNVPVQVGQQPFERIALSLNGQEAIFEEEKKVELAGEGNVLNQVPQLLKVLPALGLVLPPDTNPLNFMDRLLTAAMTRVATTTGGPAASEVTMPIAATSGGVFMSQSADPKEVKLAEKYASLEKKELAGRAKLLLEAGKISKSIYETMTGDIKTVNLSVYSDGNIQDSEVHIRLKAYEQLPEGLFDLEKIGKGTKELSNSFDDPANSADNLVKQSLERINKVKVQKVN